MFREQKSSCAKALCYDIRKRNGHNLSGHRQAPFTSFSTPKQNKPSEIPLVTLSDRPTDTVSQLSIVLPLKFWSNNF